MVVLICSDWFEVSGGWWMGLLFWVCGWGCLLIVTMGLGFACREFGFCSQWWKLWVFAFGVDGWSLRFEGGVPIATMIGV